MRQLDLQFLLLLLEKFAAIVPDMDGEMFRRHRHVRRPIAWTVAFYLLLAANIGRSVNRRYAENDTMFGRCSHWTFRWELNLRLPPLKLINGSLVNLSPPGGVDSVSLRIFKSGNDGPYVNSKRRAVNAKLTRFHCSTRAIRCLSNEHDSWSVFQSDGDGKHRTHANSQTSNKTLSTRSHSWSPTSSLMVGGASNISLIANRNSSSDSHVSLFNFCDDWATCCRVRSTRWHSTAWRLITSIPVNTLNGDQFIVLPECEKPLQIRWPHRIRPFQFLFTSYTNFTIF